MDVQKIKFAIYVPQVNMNVCIIYNIFKHISIIYSMVNLGCAVAVVIILIILYLLWKCLDTKNIDRFDDVSNCG